MEKFTHYEIEAIEQSESSPDHGVFEIKPLERGFGNTLGNSLRRVLLSNIEGYSLFAIKVPGINHEFQAMDGVKEDLTQIILNLKKLIIKIDSDVFGEQEQAQTKLEKWPTLKIDVVGKGEPITGADIETPAGFTIINKDIYIATVSEGHKFKMELYADTGRGFRTFEENKERVNAINTIAVDSNYSPIIKVAYHVTESKTSKSATTDTLTIEIATNGSVSAADALALSAKILVEHYKPIVNLNESMNEKIIMEKGADTASNQSLAISIDELELTVRSYNCLKRAGIQTIQQLTDKTKSEIEKIRNLGKKSFKEIIKKIEDRNMKLKDE